MLKSALQKTLEWLCRHWVHNPNPDSIVDSFLRFHAAIHPETQEDIYRRYTLESHIPGTVGYRMAAKGIHLTDQDFNPTNK